MTCKDCIHKDICFDRRRGFELAPTQCKDFSISNKTGNTNYEKLMNMNINEFASWLDEHCYVDNSPWIDWMQKTYCDKCEPKIADTPFGEMEYALCETGECPYQVDDLLMKDLIVKWLNEEE